LQYDAFGLWPRRPALLAAGVASKATEWSAMAAGLAGRWHSLPMATPAVVAVARPHPSGGLPTAHVRLPAPHPTSLPFLACLGCTARRLPPWGRSGQGRRRPSRCHGDGAGVRGTCRCGTQGVSSDRGGYVRAAAECRFLDTTAKCRFTRGRFTHGQGAARGCFTYGQGAARGRFTYGQGAARGRFTYGRRGIGHSRCKSGQQRCCSFGCEVAERCCNGNCVRSPPIRSRSGPGPLPVLAPGEALAGTCPLLVRVFLAPCPCSPVHGCVDPVRSSR